MSTWQTPVCVIGMTFDTCHRKPQGVASAAVKSVKTTRSLRRWRT